MTKSLNINSTVKVKLTEFGKKMLKGDHNEFWGSLGLLKDHPYIPMEEDENGYVEFHLWVLMNKLGKYCWIGREMPFETIILIDEKDLRDVE